MIMSPTLCLTIVLSLIMMRFSIINGSGNTTNTTAHINKTDPDDGNATLRVGVEDDEIEACHRNPNRDNVANHKTSEEIDELLQILYDSLDKDAQYLDDCNYSIARNITKDGEQVEEELVSSIVQKLEVFEIQLRNYQLGLWGYCAAEGAAKLKEDIKDMTNLINEQKAGGRNITICDNSKLLECHKDYKKCQCLTENRNFRNVLSGWWDNSEQSEGDSKKNITTSQCVLQKGSDCPLNSQNLCIPGTSCRIKDSQKPCSANNFDNPFFKEEEFKVSRRRRSVQVRTMVDIDDGTTTTTTTTTVEPIEDFFGNETFDTDMGNPTSEEPRRYSIIPTSYPSIHCQCMMFERKVVAASQESDVDSGVSPTNWPAKTNFIITIGGITYSYTKSFIIY